MLINRYIANKMRAQTFRALLLIGFISSTSLHAETTKPMLLSLKEAVLLSLRYNTVVQSAEIQRVVDKFNVAVAKYQFEYQYGLTGSAVYLNATTSRIRTLTRSYNISPTISRETVYGTQYQLALTNPLTYTTGSANYAYNPGVALSITQPLMQGSGREVVESKLNTAFNTDEIAKLTYKNSVINTVTQVVLDYRSVVSAENTLIIDQNALKAAIDTVSQNKSRIKAGFMAPSENVQAESQVATQKLQVATDENSVIQAKLVLLRDIGLPISTKVEVNKQISVANTSYPKGEKAQQVLLANNISYQNALYSIKNSRLSVIQAQDQQRWTLNLNGTLVQGQGSGGDGNAGLKSLANGNNQSQSVSLELTVPIDNLTVQQALVQAKVSLSQQELLAQQVKLQIEAQLESSLENLDILFLQIDLAKNATALSEQSYKDALKKAYYGQATMFEVTTLQNTLTSNRIAVISNEINYLNAITQYQQTLGTTLDAWDLHLKN